MADMGADSLMDSPLYTFLDLSGPDVDPEGHAEPEQGWPPHEVVPVVPGPVAGDEARVDARAREMAAEAWDITDARTFQTCEGEFEQFWTYRKKHFMDQARQELAVS
jgi:hypothetical protein